MYRPRFALPIAASLLLLAGCATPTSYKEPLEKLNTSVTQTKFAVTAIAQDANAAKRENLALEAASESKRFGLNDMEAIVPQNFLDIRLSGLELIEKLSARLLKVIDDEGGIKASKEVEELGHNANKLAKELNSSTVARYTEPVGRLAGTIIKIYDERKREAILNQGVSEGLPPAKKIVELLTKDFTPETETDIQGVLKDELQDTLQKKIGLYDLILESQKKLPDDKKKAPELIKQRIEAVHEIIAARNAVAALDSQLLIKALKDLDGTLDQLKAVVDSNNDPKTFSAFLEQVNTFSRSSAALLRAVNDVRRAGGGEGRDRRDGRRDDAHED